MPKNKLQHPLKQHKILIYMTFFIRISVKINENFSQSLRDFNIFHIKISSEVGFKARKTRQSRNRIEVKKTIDLIN